MAYRDNFYLTYINIIIFYLKALVANELLQKEKESLEKELEVLEKKYNKISAEFLAGLQKLTKLEAEKQVGASCFL
jgi:chaperonin cofactor prefoldin